MQACGDSLRAVRFSAEIFYRPTSVLAVIGFALAAGGATPATALTLWPTTQAQAQDTRAAAVQPAPGQRFASAARAKDKDKEKAAKDATADLLAKAKDPYNIVISIDRQQLTLYSGEQAIARSPVSTGTSGHSTPMGVFSVIQKDRWHHSNLYDDAPMYYMQRITWSGVAMHRVCHRKPGLSRLHPVAGGVRQAAVGSHANGRARHRRACTAFAGVVLAFAAVHVHGRSRRHRNRPGENVAYFFEW